MFAYFIFEQLQAIEMTNTYNLALQMSDNKEGKTIIILKNQVIHTLHCAFHYSAVETVFAAKVHRYPTQCARRNLNKKS